MFSILEWNLKNTRSCRSQTAHKTKKNSIIMVSAQRCGIKHRSTHLCVLTGLAPSASASKMRGCLEGPASLAGVIVTASLLRGHAEVSPAFDWDLQS